MPKLTVVGVNQQETAIDSDAGLTLMEAIRDTGADDLLALCGGCCSCGTCHVYVEEKWLDRLPPMSADEDGLLTISPVRRSSSRLSCQIRITEELDGLKVEMAPQF